MSQINAIRMSPAFGSQKKKKPLAEIPDDPQIKTLKQLASAYPNMVTKHGDQAPSLLAKLAQRFAKTDAQGANVFAETVQNAYNNDAREVFA